MFALAARLWCKADIADCEEREHPPHLEGKQTVVFLLIDHGVAVVLETLGDVLVNVVRTIFVLDCLACFQVGFKEDMINVVVFTSY